MPGCVISRCQIYNCSSLFVRLGPGACEWATFAFLGSCAFSIKSFTLLLCRQHGLNCIASEAFPTLKQGHRKYSLRGGSWEEGGSEKEKRLTLEFPTSAVSPETSRYMASGINIAYSVLPIKLFKFIAYFPIPSNI